MPPFDRRILTVLPQLRCPALLLGFLGIGNGVLAIGQAFAIAALVVSVVQGGDLSAAVTALVLVATARAMTGAAIETVAARAGVRASTALREELLLRSLQGNAGGTAGSESSGTTDPGLRPPDPRRPRRQQRGTLCGAVPPGADLRDRPAGARHPDHRGGGLAERADRGVYGAFAAGVCGADRPGHRRGHPATMAGTPRIVGSLHRRGAWVAGAGRIRPCGTAGRRDPAGRRPATGRPPWPPCGWRSCRLQRSNCSPRSRWRWWR